MVSKVLHDLPFSQNQPLKLADDLNISVMKNKFKKVKIQEDRTL
jgi:hypothetical protein